MRRLSAEYRMKTHVMRTFEMKEPLDYQRSSDKVYGEMTDNHLDDYSLNYENRRKIDGSKTFEMKEPPDCEKADRELADHQHHHPSLRVEDRGNSYDIEDDKLDPHEVQKDPIITFGSTVIRRGSPRLDTHRTRLKSENNSGVIGKADHKHGVKVRFQNEETPKTKCCATIKKYLWMLLLFGMLAIVNGNGADPYPPPERQSVEMGDAVKITEVRSHGCKLKLTLFNGSEEPRCKPTDLQPQETCTFENEIFKPDSYFNLEYRDGKIWKTNITSPFSFCADNSCSYSVKSGQISLDTRKKSVFTTPATSSAATTTQHTQTARETTIEYSTRVNLVSPAWKSATICLICVIIFLSCGIYCYKTWKRKARQMNGSTESCNCLPFVSVCGSPEKRAMLNGGISHILPHTPASDGSPEGQSLSDSASSGISSQSTEEECALTEVVTDGEVLHV